jgi:hypothetical protein
MAQATALVFKGSAEEQALAERVFEVMTRSYGALYARDALIRQSVSNLAVFLAQGDGTATEKMQARLDAVIKRNPDIFFREERDGEVFVATTRDGRAVARPADTKHTFRERLYEPQHPLPVDDISNIVTTVRQTIPAPEPVLISSYWRGMASVSADAQPAPVEAVEAAPVAEQPEVEAPSVATTPQVAAPQTSTTSIVLSDGTTVDLALPLDQLLVEHGAALQAELRSALDDDPLRRIVSFGDYYYAQDGLPNFGKNDLRRIRDFIVEQGMPVADTTILTDLYRERPNNANFEMVRFALDYRLAREKDFEFVGMPGAHLWSAKGLAAIGGKRLKASDIGQLFTYLQDGYDDAAGDETDGMVLHTLTFFEWEYGILPFDAALGRFLPSPLLDDQRTSVIRVEVPQHYTQYLVEVRFPTGTRGGWIWGLEEFFREYLVPGVTITLLATEEPNVVTLSYDEAPEAEAKLLHFEEKRNRFVFIAQKYYAAVDEALLPSQAQHTKLRNLKMLPMNDRKKADVVLTHVFETVGEQLGSKEEPLYWLSFDELYLAMNVLRPVSRTYLTHLLSSDDIFYADEATIGAWYYKPEPEEVVAVAAADEDETILSYDEDDE